MAERPATDMATRLLAEGFSRTVPPAAALSDPLTDTPIVVTLDQLQPYDLNPRLTRNPLYDELKASIRERGLDTPPAVTRRPGAPAYIIRNGGNTRLAILNELWAETRDERFFRIPCLFRPWSLRGDIVALTGHLAENELHGGLSFIERALGVEKARELYEAELGQQVSQAELVRRLMADGYPLQQSLLSRMQDAVRWLLPAIPNALYGGLGRPLIERLIMLRRAAERVWARRALDVTTNVDFPTLFHEVLTQFDGDLESFTLQRIQDELLGQMALLLHVDYALLQLEIETPNAPQQETAAPVSSSKPTAATDIDQVPSSKRGPVDSSDTPPPLPRPVPTQASVADVPQTEQETPPTSPSSAPTTERLQAIRQLIADSLDETPNNLSPALPIAQPNDDHAAPSAGNRHDQADDNDSVSVRARIFALAREMAVEMKLEGAIAPTSDGLGYRCAPSALQAATGTTGSALLGLLAMLSQTDSLNESTWVSGLDALLCCGGTPSTLSGQRLSNGGLARLLRLIRLARRLYDQGHVPMARSETR